MGGRRVLDPSIRVPYGMDLASYPSMEGKNVLLTGRWQASGFACSSAYMHKHQQQGFAALLSNRCMTDLHLSRRPMVVPGPLLVCLAVIILLLCDPHVLVSHLRDPLQVARVALGCAAHDCWRT